MAGSEELVGTKDDIITCENGHPMFRFVRDVRWDELTQKTQVEALHPKIDMETDLHPRCPICKGRWWVMEKGIRFEDGWRHMFMYRK